MELLKKEYEFKNGLKAIQTEATYKSDKLLSLLLLKKFDVKSLNELKDKINVMELIETMIKDDLLLEALGILLKSPNAAETINVSKLEDLTREEIIQVIEDFFILSPRLSKLFGIGKLTQASQQE